MDMPISDAFKKYFKLDDLFRYDRDWETYV